MVDLFMFGIYRFGVTCVYVFRLVCLCLLVLICGCFDVCLIVFRLNAWYIGFIVHII